MAQHHTAHTGGVSRALGRRLLKPALALRASQAVHRAAREETICEHPSARVDRS